MAAHLHLAMCTHKPSTNGWISICLVWFGYSGLEIQALNDVVKHILFVGKCVQAVNTSKIAESELIGHRREFFHDMLNLYGTVYIDHMLFAF